MNRDERERYVKAGAHALRKWGPVTDIVRRERMAARDVIAAVYPLIESDLRDSIATEIEGLAPPQSYVNPASSAYRYARNDAARIARGSQP